jgi:hypothetical protein
MSMGLLGVERTPSPSELWKGTLAIVLVDRDRCLRCGGNTVTYAYGQLPLFRSHGYGAVKQTTITICQQVGCEWNFVSDVTEVNPRRYVA